MYANPNQLRFQKSVALIKPIRLSFKQEGAKYFFFWTSPVYGHHL